MPQAMSKSFWISDAGDYEPNAPLEGDCRCDVLVVGGGLAGLSAAWHLRKDEPSLDVVLIEAEIVGWGASGRNAGVLLPDFGPDHQIVRRKYGAQRAQDMATYGRRAMDYTAHLIETHGLESEYRKTGRLLAAFDDKWVPALESQLRHMESIETPCQWLDQTSVQREFAGNANFRAAIFEPEAALIHPCKHVRELKRLATASGVRLYEETPAIHIAATQSEVRVVTPRGTISASKLVLATNSYTNQLQGPIGAILNRDQAPTIARASVTEPLSRHQWERLGWDRRCALQSSLLLMHIMTPLTDGRILFNYGYHSGHPRSGEMEPSMSAEAAFDSFEHLRRIFPVLREVRMAQTWGGQVSTTFDRIPHLGVLEKGRVVYLTGCWGHGLAVNHLHGQTISDLVREVRSDLTSLWFIHHPKARWPLSPIDHWGKLFVWGQMRRRNKRMTKGSIFE